MNNKVKIIISVVLALGLIIPVALLAISAATQSLPFYILPMLSYGAKNTSTGQNITLQNVSIYSASNPFYYGSTTRISYRTNYGVRAWENYQLNFMFDMQAFGVNDDAENIRFNFDIWAASFYDYGDTINVVPTGGQIIIVDNKNQNLTLGSGKITINLGSKYNIDGNNVTHYNIGFDFNANQWKNYWTASGMSKIQIYLNFRLEVYPSDGSYEQINPTHELYMSDFTITYDKKEPEPPIPPDPESSEEPSAPPVDPPDPPDPESSEEPSAPPVEPSQPPEESSNGSGGGDNSNGGGNGGNGCDCDLEHVCGILEQIKLEILVLQDLLQIAIDSNIDAFKEALKEHFDDIQQVIDNNADTIASAMDRQTSEWLDFDVSREPISGEEQNKSTIEANKSLEEEIKNLLPEWSVDGQTILDLVRNQSNAFRLIQSAIESVLIGHIYEVTMFSLLIGLALYIVGKTRR